MSKASNTESALNFAENILGHRSFVKKRIYGTTEVEVVAISQAMTLFDACGVEPHERKKIDSYMQKCSCKGDEEKLLWANPVFWTASMPKVKKNPDEVIRLFIDIDMKWNLSKNLHAQFLQNLLMK